MDLQKIILTRLDEYLFVNLANPPVNALSREVIEELHAMLDYAQKEDSIRQIFIGHGGKFFSAGADLEELREVIMSADCYIKAGMFSRRGQMLTMRIARFPKKIIATVNGYCLGGGLELALACHEQIFLSQAKIGLPEATLGIIPGWGGTALAPLRIKGAHKSFLSRAQIAAPSALSDGDIKTETKTPSPLALKWTELLMTFAARRHKALECDLEYHFAMEAAIFAFLCSESDAREGLSAFFEKRKTNFSAASPSTAFDHMVKIFR
ncbi:MAG: enoyl-CoA hydratase/isomerase family protein [Candidatus Niyogibacteria bacterium]|nr:MAG: enoyl-CoA hydratase/isomerase family protein [Candidatus Niyogibacteria bacterium]